MISFIQCMKNKKPGDPPMVRPVRCFFCGRKMYYSGDKRHVPEVSVCTIPYGCNIPSDQRSFYAHADCWNKQLNK